jgi:hypothetical protein
MNPYPLPLPAISGWNLNSFLEVAISLFLRINLTPFGSMFWFKVEKDRRWWWKIPRNEFVSLH